MRKQVLFGVLAVVLLFGLVGLASAGTATFDDALTPGTATNSSNPVVVRAKVNPKITLTIAAPNESTTTPLPTDCWVDFGAIDPGSYGPVPVTLTVDSNKAFTLDGVQDTSAFGSGGAGQITLNRTHIEDWANGVKGVDQAFTDNYSIVVPWETEPGEYTAEVVYTVAQK